MSIEKYRNQTFSDLVKHLKDNPDSCDVDAAISIIEDRTTLSEREAEAYFHREIAGRSYEEIAEEMQVGFTTVQTKLDRVREKIEDREGVEKKVNTYFLPFDD